MTDASPMSNSVLRSLGVELSSTTALSWSKTMLTLTSSVQQLSPASISPLTRWKKLQQSAKTYKLSASLWNRCSMHLFTLLPLTTSSTITTNMMSISTTKPLEGMSCVLSSRTLSCSTGPKSKKKPNLETSRTWSTKCSRANEPVISRAVITWHSKEKKKKGKQNYRNEKKEKSWRKNDSMRNLRIATWASINSNIFRRILKWLRIVSRSSRVSLTQWSQRWSNNSQTEGTRRWESILKQTKVKMTHNNNSLTLDEWLTSLIRKFY